MIIRKATEADWGEWLRMRDELWPEPDIQHQKEMRHQMARPADKAVFVVERPDGRLGGFLEAGTREWAEGCLTSPVGYIEGWYVDPDLRRQGVGRALVEAAEQWARDLGLQEMGSDAEIDNEVSIAAHNALGYRESGRVVEFARRLDESRH
jgi:aminoglycoside 6'-N-acetyltransferase I